MVKSIAVTRKRRGRPATGQDPHLTGRFPESLVRQLEAWADRNGVSRSEAMRSLIEQALAAHDMADQKKRKVIAIHLPSGMLKTLDDYRLEQAGELDRSEAVCRLLEIALEERWKWQDEKLVHDMANRRRRR